MNKTLKRKMKGLLAFAMSMAIMATSVFFGDTAVFAADVPTSVLAKATFYNATTGMAVTLEVTNISADDTLEVYVVQKSVSGNITGGDPIIIDGVKCGIIGIGSPSGGPNMKYNNGGVTVEKESMYTGSGAKPSVGAEVYVVAGVTRNGSTIEQRTNALKITVPNEGENVTVTGDSSTTPEEKKEDPKTETPTGNDQKTETTTTTEPTKISDQKPGEEIKVSDKDTKAKKAGTFSVSKDGKSATFTEVNKSATKIEVPATVTNEAGEEIPVTAIDPKAFEGSKATSIDTSKVQTTGLTADQFKGASKVTVIKINGKKLKAGKINKNFLRKLKKLKKVKVVCSKKQFKKIQKALEKAAKKTKRKGGTKVIRVSK